MVLVKVIFSAHLFPCNKLSSISRTLKMFKDLQKYTSGYFFTNKNWRIINVLTALWVGVYLYICIYLSYTSKLRSTVISSVVNDITKVFCKTCLSIHKDKDYINWLIMKWMHTSYCYRKRKHWLHITLLLISMLLENKLFHLCQIFVIYW